MRNRETDTCCIRLKWIRVLLAFALAGVLLGESAAFADMVYSPCPGCDSPFSVLCAKKDENFHHWLLCMTPGCRYYQDGVLEPHEGSSRGPSTATCVSPGPLTFLCDVCCSYFSTVTGLDPLNHENLVWTIFVRPTHTADGNIDYWRCSGCGKYFSDWRGTAEISQEETVLRALGHEDIQTLTMDSEYHWKQCSCGAQLEKEAHTFTGPSCTVPEHCAACGFQAAPALGHTVVADPAVPPACGQEGLTEGSHCSACDAIFVEQTFIPALAHTVVTDPAVPPACKKDGLTEGSHCSACGAVLAAQTAVPALGHWYGVWTPDGEGHHTASCRRAGCSHIGKAECAPVSAMVGSSGISACPVCGGLSAGDTAAASGVLVEALAAGALPARGELAVRRWDSPIADDPAILRLYAIAFEYAGKPEAITGPVRVTLPMEGDLPAFRLTFTDVSGQAVELEYGIMDGMLSFEIPSAGILALVAE